jgi:hypothetical protein
MKAIEVIKILRISIMGSLLLLPFSTFAQEEYDDMYFSPKDRKEVKKESVYTAEKGVVNADENRNVINPSSSTQIYGNAQENYSSRNVNPEYIERYKSTSKDSATVDELAEDGSYYVENYDRSNFTEGTEGNQQYQNYTRPGNYYGYAGSFNDPFYSGFNRFGGGFYDPFFSPYGSGWGFMPGFSMGLSMGTGWGWGHNPFYSPWGYSRFHNPWYSRHYYNPWAYDPFYGPYAGMGSFGYPGFYSNNYYYVNTNRENISPYNRRVSRGADNYLVKEDAVPNRRTATENQQKVTAGDNNNNRARIEKDYSRSQNEYYTRSRARYETTARANNATVNSSRYQGNSVGTTSTPRVRSSRSEVEYSRPSYRRASDSRSTYSRGSNQSSSWSNNSYQRSRSGNTYSSPSRSSSGYSSGTFNSGSSGSRSSGYSAPSRSSGSSSSGTRSSGRR